MPWWLSLRLRLLMLEIQDLKVFFVGQFSCSIYGTVVLGENSFVWSLFHHSGNMVGKAMADCLPSLNTNCFEVWWTQWMSPFELKVATGCPSPNTCCYMLNPNLQQVHVGFVTYSLRLQQHGTMEPPTSEPLGWQWNHLKNHGVVCPCPTKTMVSNCASEKNAMWNGPKFNIFGTTTFNFTCGIAIWESRLVLDIQEPYKVGPPVDS